MSLLSGGSMAYSQLVTAAFSVYLAAKLGAEAFGSMNLARTILIDAIYLTPLGLDQALQRHFGERRSEARNCDELFWLRLIPLALASVIALALVLGGGTFVQKHLFCHKGFGAVLAITLLALPFYTDMMVMGGAYRGLYKPLPSVVGAFLVQPTVRVIAVMALWPWMSGLWAAVDGTLISFLLAWLYVAYQGERDFPLRWPPVTGAFKAAIGVLRYAPVLGVSTFIFITAKTLDVTSLGFFGNLTEVGRYSVVVMVCQLVGTVGNALGMTIGTSVASAAKDGDKPLLIHLLGENMELSALLSAPFCIAIAVWGTDVDLFLGPNYELTHAVLVIAAFSQWIVTVTHSCSAALSMTGRHNVEFGNNLLALGVSALACVLLVPHWGMIGAALSTFIMVVILNGLRQVQIGRMLGDALLRFRFLYPLALSAAVAAPLVWIDHAAGIRAWWWTGLIAGLHVTLSFGLMFGLMKEAKGVLRLFARAPRPAVPARR